MDFVVKLRDYRLSFAATMFAPNEKMTPFGYSAIRTVPGRRKVRLADWKIRVACKPPSSPSAFVNFRRASSGHYAIDLATPTISQVFSCARMIEEAANS
jgi:hypothetical protein